MKKSIIIILFICILCSCAKNSIIESRHSGASQDYSTFVMSDKLYDQQIRKDTILAYDLGKYLEYLAPTDYVAGISSSQTNPLSKKFIYAYSGISSHCQQHTKADALDEDIHVAINDIPILPQLKTKGNVINNKADLAPLFGTTVTFSIGASSDAITKSEITPIDWDDPEPGTPIDMYLPETIEINLPSADSEIELYPLCDYNNFLLKWNPDFNNENGVILVVEWTGIMLLGEDYSDAYIRCTDLVADTGETIINPEMFEGIPDTALCHLTILRGNVEHALVYDYSYKILGETHQCMSFILLRNIKNV